MLYFIIGNGGETPALTPSTYSHIRPENINFVIFVFPRRSSIRAHIELEYYHKL